MSKSSPLTLFCLSSCHTGLPNGPLKIFYTFWCNQPQPIFCFNICPYLCHTKCCHHIPSQSRFFLSKNSTSLLTTFPASLVMYFIEKWKPFTCIYFSPPTTSVISSPTGRCPRGALCSFSHGQANASLPGPAMKVQPIMCKNILETGSCQRGLKGKNMSKSREHSPWGAGITTACLQLEWIQPNRKIFCYLYVLKLLNPYQSNWRHFTLQIKWFTLVNF